jgi:hypothetical protein
VEACGRSHALAPSRILILPYVPSSTEAKRLRAAVDRASFSEVERIFWLFAFMALLAVDGILLGGRAAWIGVIGALGGFAVLYWRLRGGHLLRNDPPDRDLHGPGLRTRDQRAFTALMLRQAFTGRNPLSPRPEHDPLASWAQRVEKPQAPSEDPT